MKDILYRGIYNNDYFSGAQVAIYIGDVLVDEITSISYGVSQSRTPLYGYASRLFDAVSEGNVLVQGQFTINFKEAGYLWLVLQRYKALVKGEPSPFMEDRKNQREYTNDLTIEQIVNKEQDLSSDLLKNIAAQLKYDTEVEQTQFMNHIADAKTSLSGYSSRTRAFGGIGRAENIFETFENTVWGPERSVSIEGRNVQVGTNRRTDEPDLNPFDIYVAFGDYVGDDRIHHTVQKLKDVYLLGASKQVVIDGQPVQEAYSFIARDLI